MLFNNEGFMNAAVNSQLIDELKKKVKIQDSSTNAVDATTCLIFRTLDLCRKYREQFTEVLLVEISCKPQLTRIDLLFECFQQKLPTTEVISNKQSFEIHSIEDETPIPLSESNFWNNSENVKLLQAYLIKHLEKWIPTLVRQHEKLKIFLNSMPNSAAHDMNDECIAHIQSATKNKYTEIKITYADCDLLVMVMYFWKNFEINGLKKLWMEYKCGRSTKIIPVEILVQNYNQSFRQVLPAMHFLTGLFYTSKIGTKLKAIEANSLKYLENFATDVQQWDLGDILKAAETYIVRVLYKKKTCETFNKLRVSLFKSGKITVITELPPCSEEITYHI
ncbi:hypothetical protein KQX54_014266 [Cotesia glomerata]|uniref:Uncharacterized protein n=1 Tax=Cotesia glomerata TaxID=32391 RepID=A0AAV7I0A9_COTGL|nr:hypothetical protein KQX54_014266 [Cotesia glomerata]